MTDQPADQSAIRPSLVWRYGNFLLGALAVVLFFAAWQAIFLVVPFNPLFMSKLVRHRAQSTPMSKAAVSSPRP